MLPTAATEHYRNQQTRALRAEALVRDEWRQVDGDFDAGWEQVRPRVNLIVASAQLGAARAGDAYVPAVLDDLGESTPAEFDVRPASLSDVASDGRPLDTLLDGVTVKAKIAIAQGQPDSEALQTAGRWIGMVTRTQVADAGRSSTGLGVFARRGIGYVRYVSPPSCARCALLAGKWFRSNQGFQRHINCDCIHLPASQDAASGLVSSPDELFSSGQVRGLTNAETSALSQGADPGSVINARRGMTSDGMYTTERAGRRRRPTPEAIYRFSKTRDEAVKALVENGYVTVPIAVGV